jgi:hypothetical protein
MNIIILNSVAMFKPILPDDLLNIVSEYAKLSINNTCRDIDIVIVQQLLNCWFDQSFRYFGALCEVCYTNDFDLLVWLCHLEGQENISTIMREKKRTSDLFDFALPLRIACTPGNKKIIMWLVQFFEYERNDVCYMDDACLIELCYYGHNAIAKWFIERFKIKKICGFAYLDRIILAKRSQVCDAITLAKLFIRWQKTNFSVWKMMRTDWRRVYDHVQNCDCENKKFAVCRCGVKICFFLRDYHVEHRGCCYACDK